MQYYAHVACIVGVNDSGHTVTWCLSVMPDFGVTLP